MDNSIVRLWDDHPQKGGRFVGTGFFIDNNKIMTARHVIDDNQNDTVYISDMPDKSIMKLCYDNIISLKRDIDILIMPDEYSVEIYDIDFSMDIKKTQAVSILGYVDAEQSMYNIQSKITGKSNIHKLYSLRGQIGSGMSGSPVIIKDKIIGIVQATDRNKNISYFIPLKTAYNDIINIISNNLNSKIIPKNIYCRLNRESQVFYIVNDFFVEKSNIKILLVKGRENSGHHYLYERIVGDIIPNINNNVHYHKHYIKWGAGTINNKDYFCMYVADSIFGDYNISIKKLSDKLRTLEYNHILYYEINIKNIDKKSIKNFYDFWKEVSKYLKSINIVIFLGIKSQNEPIYKKPNISFLKNRAIYKESTLNSSLSYTTPQLTNITKDEIYEWLRDSSTANIFDTDVLKSGLTDLYRNKKSMPFLDVVDYINDKNFNSL